MIVQQRGDPGRTAVLMESSKHTVVHKIKA
jgi:hypothetical protein